MQISTGREVKKISIYLLDGILRNHLKWWLCDQVERWVNIYVFRKAECKIVSAKDHNYVFKIYKGKTARKHDICLF